MLYELYIISSYFTILILPTCDSYKCGGVAVWRCGFLTCQFLTQKNDKVSSRKKEYHVGQESKIL